MKKLKKIIGIAALSIIVLYVLIRFLPTPIDTFAIKDYDGYKKQFSDVKEYELGVNIYGDIVFKHPTKALKTFKKENAQALELIKEEYGLEEFSYGNYQLYLTYGWQVSADDAGMKEQTQFVSAFLDIFENSFNRGSNSIGARFGNALLNNWFIVNFNE